MKTKGIWNYYKNIPVNKRETHIKMGLLKENKKINFLEKVVHWFILCSAFNLKGPEEDGTKK